MKQPCRKKEGGAGKESRRKTTGVVCGTGLAGDWGLSFGIDFRWRRLHKQEQGRCGLRSRANDRNATGHKRQQRVIICLGRKVTL